MRKALLAFARSGELLHALLDAVLAFVTAVLALFALAGGAQEQTQLVVPRRVGAVPPPSPSPVPVPPVPTVGYSVPLKRAPSPPPEQGDM